MASGFGAGSFAAGFGKSLTDVLLGHRKEEADRADRELALQMPIGMKLLEEGDPSFLERIITAHNPALAAKLKKNSPFADLSKLMGPQVKMSADQTSQPAAATGAYGLPLPQEEPAPPGSPQLLQARTVNTEPIPGTSAPPAGSTFFGSPVMTPTQRAEQAAQANVASDKMQIESRRKIAQQMGMTPEKAVDYALYGTRPPQEQRQSAEPYQAVDGVDADGKTVSAVFDQSKGLYVDAITKVPIRGFHKSPSASKTQTEFDQFLASYAKDKNKSADALSSTEMLDARKKYAEAGRAATTTNTDPQALARLAIRNPTVLQGLTPTVAGGVLAAIASDPQLSQQYEASRMAPIRHQAQTAIDAMNDLLITDPKTGKVLDLTPGAKALYGYSGYGGKGMAGALGGIDASTSKAALDQLTGTLVIDLLRDMKAQSRTGATGFGQLSARELDVLQSSATMLQGKISEPRALQELKALRDKFGLILQPGKDEQPQAGAPGAAASPAQINLDTPVFIGPDGKPRVGTP